LQTDRVGTGEALEIDFYKRRFLVAEDLRDQAAKNFISFADSPFVFLR